MLLGIGVWAVIACASLLIPLNRAGHVALWWPPVSTAVRALQAPARCGPARVRHYIFDGVLLIGSGLMVPHQELFVTLQTLLAFSVIGRVKDELRRQNLICHLARFRDVGLA